MWRSMKVTKELLSNTYNPNLSIHLHFCSVLLLRYLLSFIQTVVKGHSCFPFSTHYSQICQLYVYCHLAVNIKGTVVPELILSTTWWGCMGAWRYSSTILDLGTRQVNCQLLPQPLYPGGGGVKNPRYPLDRLGRLQSQSRPWKRENVLAPTGNQTLTPWPASP
jgi:hypothetical protein